MGIKLLAVMQNVSMKPGVQILLVDDERTIRGAIRMLLEHTGHEVWEAKGGEAALRLLAERKFDVVITDFFMPGMHGDELVSRIRQMLPGQPIIMATAFPEECQAFGHPTGREALLRKPFTLKELHDAIKQVLTPHSADQPNICVASATPPPDVRSPPNP
jgi:CheY-like chemotaxis protein